MAPSHSQGPNLTAPTLQPPSLPRLRLAVLLRLVSELKRALNEPDPLRGEGFGVGGFFPGFLGNYWALTRSGGSYAKRNKPPCQPSPCLFLSHFSFSLVTFTESAFNLHGRPLQPPLSLSLALSLRFRAFSKAARQGRDLWRLLLQTEDQKYFGVSLANTILHGSTTQKPARITVKHKGLQCLETSI